MTPKLLRDYFRQAFMGYGRAVRMDHEPPLPGEPFMSMEDAARLAAKTHEKLIVRPQSSRLLPLLEDARRDYAMWDYIEPIETIIGVKRNIFGKGVPIYATTDQIIWAGEQTRSFVINLLDRLIDSAKKNDNFDCGPRTKDRLAEQLMQEFYVSDSYNHEGAPPAATVKAAIMFTLLRLEEMKEIT